MKKIILNILLLFIFSNVIYADRDDPVQIKPVKYKHYLITAPNTANFMGEIIVLDKKTKNRIWSKKIYTVKYNREIEGDVQAVYITKISLRNNILTIQNEKRYIYELNLDTQEIKVIKGERSIYAQ